jgi:hypothetical protein
MMPVIAVTKQTRQVLLDMTATLTTEQLNHIPAGFSNNIAWNMGHLVVAQQILCYRNAGLPMQIDQEVVQQYQKGSRPQGWIPEAEIGWMRHCLLAFTDQLAQDVHPGGLFSRFQPVQTSFGVRLNNIADAVAYSCMHDGLHTGYITALKKLL